VKTVPQYRKLYEQLRRHIKDGTYKVDDILPSENELCVINGVTRPTVRKALDMLANDGFIKKRQGYGSVVQKPLKSIGILSFSGTTSAIGKENLKTVVIKKPVVMPWPDNFTFELTDSERESGCINFERLRYVNDIPVFYDITYLPNIGLPRFTSRNMKNTSLFDTLREFYQIEVKGGEQNFNAILAPNELQELLNVNHDHPILKLQRKLHTNRLNFNIYSMLFCNTEEHSLFGQF